MNMITYDKTLKVGDYVTGYNRGIHIILEIGPERLGTYNPGDIAPPLVTLKQVLTPDLLKSSKRKSICDMYYCAKVTKEDLLKWAKETYENSTRDINEVVV